MSKQASKLLLKYNQALNFINQLSYKAIPAIVEI